MNNFEFQWEPKPVSPQWGNLDYVQERLSAEATPHVFNRIAPNVLAHPQFLAFCIKRNYHAIIPFHVADDESGSPSQSPTPQMDVNFRRAIEIVRSFEKSEKSDPNLDNLVSLAQKIKNEEDSKAASLYLPSLTFFLSPAYIRALGETENFDNIHSFYSAFGWYVMNQAEKRIFSNHQEGPDLEAHVVLTHHRAQCLLYYTNSLDQTALTSLEQVKINEKNQQYALIHNLIDAHFNSNDKNSTHSGALVEIVDLLDIYEKINEHLFVPHKKRHTKDGLFYSFPHTEIVSLNEQQFMGLLMSNRRRTPEFYAISEAFGKNKSLSAEQMMLYVKKISSASFRKNKDNSSNSTQSEVALLRTYFSSQLSHITHEVLAQWCITTVTQNNTAFDPDFVAQLFPDFFTSQNAQWRDTVWAHPALFGTVQISDVIEHQTPWLVNFLRHHFSHTPSIASDSGLSDLIAGPNVIAIDNIDNMIDGIDDELDNFLTLHRSFSDEETEKKIIQSIPLDFFYTHFQGPSDEKIRHSITPYFPTSFLGDKKCPSSFFTISHIEAYLKSGLELKAFLKRKTVKTYFSQKCDAQDPHEGDHQNPLLLLAVGAHPHFYDEALKAGIIKKPNAHLYLHHLNHHCKSNQSLFHFSDSHVKAFMGNEGDCQTLLGAENKSVLFEILKKIENPIYQKPNFILALMSKFDAHKVSPSTVQKMRSCLPPSVQRYLVENFNEIEQLGSYRDYLDIEITKQALSHELRPAAIAPQTTQNLSYPLTPSKLTKKNKL